MCGSCVGAVQKHCGVLQNGEMMLSCALASDGRDVNGSSFIGGATLPRCGSYYYCSAERLLSSLGQGVADSNRPVAVIAGSFVLCYDTRTGCLLPLIRETVQGDAVVPGELRADAEFPVRSFRSACRLASETRHRGVKCRIAVTVNDHCFRASDLAVGEDVDAGVLAWRLRKDFYATFQALPDLYEAILREHSLQACDAVLQNDLPARDGQDILPKHAVYFSETVLRNRFKRKSWSELKHAHGLYACSCNGPLAFPGNGGPCVDEGEVQALGPPGSNFWACAGEVIQLLRDLSQRSFARLVFFVPALCRRQVNAGLKVAIRHLTELEEVVSVLEMEGRRGCPGGAPGHAYEVTVYRKHDGTPSVLLDEPVEAGLTP